MQFKIKQDHANATIKEMKTGNYHLATICPVAQAINEVINDRVLICYSKGTVIAEIGHKKYRLPENIVKFVYWIDDYLFRGETPQLENEVEFELEIENV